jgi:hypothetical protein
MKIIFILLLFTLLLLVGCNNIVEEPALDNKWIVPVDMWEQMENIFEQMEDELVSFVAYLEENELLDNFEGVHIIFTDDEESAMREISLAVVGVDVVVYNGEIVHPERLFGSARVFSDDPELTDIAKAIDERGIIAQIIFRGGADDATIQFQVKPNHPYIADIRGMQNNFHYVKGDAPTWRRIEQIRENWYMEIAPPHD